MDISAVLDATEPVECEFLEHKITAHVYTAGAARFTKEERDAYQELREDGDAIVMMRTVLPSMISGWDFDGSAMERHGEPFPPTPENMKRTPDSLLAAVFNAIVEKWRAANPTSGEESPTTSEATETPVSLPASIAA